MMSNEDTFAYLMGKSYSKEEISRVMGNMGLDPNAEEFAIAAVEQIEKILNAVEKGAKNQLPQGSETITEEVALVAAGSTVAMATKELEADGITVDIEVLAPLAQSAIAQYIQVGDVIADMGEEALKARLRERNAALYGRLFENMQAESAVIDEVFSPENRKAMVEAAVPKYQPKVTKDQFQAWVTDRTVELNAPKCDLGDRPRPKFDMQAFIKKMNTPKTPEAQAQA